MVAQRQPFLRRAAGEIVLRQVRPVDRRRIVAAQHDDAALVFPPPQHLGRSESRRAAADDHDPPRLIRLRARPCFGPGALLTHDDLSVALIHPPNIDRTQRRRAQGSPVRRSKQAWCQGQRTVPSTMSPPRAGRYSACTARRWRTSRRRDARAALALFSETWRQRACRTIWQFSGGDSQARDRGRGLRLDLFQPFRSLSHIFARASLVHARLPRKPNVKQLA